MSDQNGRQSWKPRASRKGTQDPSIDGGFFQNRHSPEWTFCIPPRPDELFRPSDFCRRAAKSQRGLDIDSAALIYNLRRAHRAHLSRGVAAFPRITPARQARRRWRGQASPWPLWVIGESAHSFWNTTIGVGQFLRPGRRCPKTCSSVNTTPSPPNSPTQIRRWSSLWRKKPDAGQLRQRFRKRGFIELDKTPFLSAWTRPPG